MIILDNTVLTSLAHLDLLGIPSELFGEVVISKSVYDEGTTPAGDEERVERIKKVSIYADGLPP